MATVSLDWGSTGVYERQSSHIASKSNTGWTSDTIGSGTATYRRFTICLAEAFGSANVQISQISLTATVVQTGFDATSSCGDYRVYATKSDVSQTRCVSETKVITKKEKTWTHVIYPTAYDLMSNKFTWDNKTCIELALNLQSNRTGNTITASNVSVTVTYTAPSYTITTSAGTGGSISPSSPSVERGSSQTFTITPNTGYNVSDVKVDGTSVGAVSSYTFSNVTATHTIAATFALKTYTITATAGSHGSISPASASVTHGGSQTFTITPDTGYNIEDVKVDGVSVGAVSSYAFSNVTATHTISATFVSAQTQPYITSAAITYGGSQVGPSNKIPAGQGYIIRVEVIEQ